MFFRGIPYARTPRFELPQEYVWEGVFDATKGETDCPQRSTYVDESKEPSFYFQEFRSNLEFTYDESFMTLNVIAPEKAKNCPVLVFIHGGGHETGTVGELPYGLSTEYVKRDVILVSVGYRLNVFSLYEGNNFGLHDLVAAVYWVRDNIAAFGGDPARITLCGQSAGAMSITDLLYCNKLKGVVQGAILMSGGGMIPRVVGPWTREEAKPFWAEVRKEAGVASEEEFKVLPAEVIWHAWYKVSRTAKGLRAIQPSIDGDIITDVPQEVFKQKKELDIPIMIGVTSQDFMPVALYEVALSWGKKNAACGKAPVYGYFFDRELPGNRFKAFHSCDLWYLFGSMKEGWRPFEAVDYELAEEMMNYAANFVRSANPNGTGLPEWKPISKKQKGFRLFDGVSEGYSSPWKCRQKVWKTMLWDKGPM